MAIRLGINYWPISSAMYWWRRFDPSEFANDCIKIRAAGFESLRIFLLWEDFQPAPNQISQAALTNLTSVADIAGNEGLSIIVTLFTGHMSGANWIPTWALEPIDSPSLRFRTISDGRVVNTVSRNWYIDEEIIQAQSLLAHEVAAALSDRKSVWAWDLGNENSNCVIPPSREASVLWLHRIANELRLIDESRPITLGLHMEDLEEDRKLGPAEAAQVCDFLSMHGYPMYCDWAEGPSDALLLPFLGLITHWLGGCEVLFEEFGATAIPDDVRTSNANPILLSESEAALYTQEAITRLNEYGFSGGLLWCFADYARDLWALPPLDKAQHERYFGLWRENGSAKPAVNVIKDLSGTLYTPGRTEVDWIDVSPESFYQNPKEILRRLYRQFRSRHDTKKNE